MPLSSSSVSYLSFDSYENQFFHILMYISGSISLIFGIIGIYFILKFSPQTFGSYKYFLLNISICAVIFDVYMTIIYQPKSLYPALVMCPEGLIKTSSNTVGYIMFLLFLIFFGASTVAVTSAFFYRFIALKNKLDLILCKKFIGLLVFVHIFFQAPSVILYCLAIVDKETVNDVILKKWPLIGSHYLHQGCAIIHKDVTPFPRIFIGICFTSFMVGFPIITTLVIKSFLLLKNQRNFMCLKTYRMHFYLLISLIFQFLVPLLTLYIPFMILWIFVIFEIENVAFYVQILYFLATFHSPLNTILMLGFVPSFRKTIIAFVRRRSSVIPSNISSLQISIRHQQKIVPNYIDKKQFTNTFNNSGENRRN